MRHLWGLMNLSHTKQPHAWTTWHAPDWIPPYHNCKDEAKKSNLCKHLNLCIVCDHLEGHFTFQFRVLKPPGVQALMVLDFMLWGINSNQRRENCVSSHFSSLYCWYVSVTFLRWKKNKLFAEGMMDFLHYQANACMTVKRKRLTTDQTKIIPMSIKELLFFHVCISAGCAVIPCQSFFLNNKSLNIWFPYSVLYGWFQFVCIALFLRKVYMTLSPFFLHLWTW